MKKLLLIAFFTIFSLQNCFADQLQMITLEQAMKAVALIKKQKAVVLFCGCCENDTQKLIEITGSYFKPANYKHEGVPQYYVILQGKNIQTGETFDEDVDLAYVYIKNNNSTITVGKFLKYKCDPCVESIDWTLKSENLPETGNNNTNLKDNLVTVQNGEYIYKTLYNFTYNGKVLTLVIVQDAPINDFISRDSFLSYANYYDLSIRKGFRDKKDTTAMNQIYDLNVFPDITIVIDYNKNSIDTKTTINGQTTTTSKDWATIKKEKEEF